MRWVRVSQTSAASPSPVERTAITVRPPVPGASADTGRSAAPEVVKLVRILWWARTSHTVKRCRREPPEEVVSATASVRPSGLKASSGVSSPVAFGRGPSVLRARTAPVPVERSLGILGAFHQPGRLHPVHQTRSPACGQYLLLGDGPHRQPGTARPPEDEQHLEHQMADAALQLQRPPEAVLQPVRRPCNRPNASTSALR
ncbi:hypothetical protein GCM10027074_66590 [Streptomyces deserti]